MVANRFDFIIQGKNAAGAAFASVKKGFGDMDSAAGTSTRNVTRRLSAIGKRIGGVGRTIATGLVAGTAAAGAAFVGFTAAVINSDRELQVAADRAGRTASQMRILRDAAVGVGEDIGTAEGLLETFNERVQEAAEGAGEGYEVFELLGISLQDASGVTKSSNELFVELSKSLNGMENRADAAALATRLLGGDGFKLIPAIAGIEDSLLGTNEEFDKQVKASEDAAKKWRELKKGVTDFAAQAVRPLIPFLTDLLDSIINISERIQTAFAPAFEDAGGSAESTGRFLSGVGKIIKETLIPAFSNVGDAILTFIENTGGIEAWQKRLTDAFAFIGRQAINLTAGFRRVAVVASVAFGQTTWEDAQQQLEEITRETQKQKAAIQGVADVAKTSADNISKFGQSYVDENGTTRFGVRELKKEIEDVNEELDDGGKSTGIITENISKAANSVNKAEENQRKFNQALAQLPTDELREYYIELPRLANETEEEYQARRLKAIQDRVAAELQAIADIEAEELSAAQSAFNRQRDLADDYFKKLELLDDDYHDDRVKNIDTTTEHGLQQGILLINELLDLQKEQADEYENYYTELREQGHSEEQARELVTQKRKRDEAQAAIDDIQEAEEAAIEETEKRQKEAYDKLKTGIENAVKGLITGTTSWSDLLKSVRDNALNSIVNKISGNIAGSIANAWTNSTNAAGTGFTNLANSLTGDGIFGGFFKWLGDSFSSIFNGAKNLLGKLFGGIFGGGGSGPVQSIVNTAVPQLAKTFGGAGTTAAAAAPAIAPVVAGPASPTLIGAGTGTAAAGTTAGTAGSGIGALGVAGLFAGAVGAFAFLGRDRESNFDKALKRLREGGSSEEDIARVASQRAKRFSSSERESAIAEFRDEAEEDVNDDRDRFVPGLRIPRKRRERERLIEEAIARRAVYLKAEDNLRKEFNIPELQFGGIVRNRPGGTTAIIGERGDEAVLPLPGGADNFIRAIEALGNLGPRQRQAPTQVTVNNYITTEDGTTTTVTTFAGEDEQIAGWDVGDLTRFIEGWSERQLESGGRFALGGVS